MSEIVEREAPQVWESRIRPASLGEFIGQESLKESLSISLSAAKMRKGPLDHVLLYGPPGLGKTSLARIIAQELGVQIRCLSGPSLEKPGDIASLLTSLGERDLVFIDEVHRLPAAVEEVLYSAMEDYYLDILVGQGTAAKSVRLHLPPFTLVGATTRIGLLTQPLLSRFGILLHLDYYPERELTGVVKRSAGLLQINLSAEAAEAIASRSRGTPRRANMLLKRLRDVAEVKGRTIVDGEIAEEAFSLLDVDPVGLDLLDRKILLTLIEKFDGGPVGLKTLSAAVNEEKDTLEDVYEPYLIQQGYLEVTPRGRQATTKAYEHFHKGLSGRRLL